MFAVQEQCLRSYIRIEKAVSEDNLQAHRTWNMKYFCKIVTQTFAFPFFYGRIRLKTVAYLVSRLTSWNGPHDVLNHCCFLFYTKVSSPSGATSSVKQFTIPLQGRLQQEFVSYRFTRPCSTTLLTIWLFNDQQSTHSCFNTPQNFHELLTQFKISMKVSAKPPKKSSRQQHSTRTNCRKQAQAYSSGRFWR